MAACFVAPAISIASPRCKKKPLQPVERFIIYLVWTEEPYFFRPNNLLPTLALPRSGSSGILSGLPSGNHPVFKNRTNFSIDQFDGFGKRGEGS
jgi:hypothetical protein